ncbi:MAG: hypothetical protein BroJett011_03720 [Chloroflexota bacterium]|nr:MAG: hypothetical protein BroJett011_03720 [Chloroflexota bacterium]
MTVVLWLSEHDAQRILLLVKKEKEQAEPVWRDYWARLASEMHEKIGQNYAGQRRS